MVTETTCKKKWSIKWNAIGPHFGFVNSTQSKHLLDIFLIFSADCEAI